MGSMRKCVAAYPHLATLADADNPQTRLGTGLNEVRRHAVDLSRGAIVDEMQKLHEESMQLDEMQRATRRDNIQTRLKRLVPGTTTALKAMCSSTGEVTTNPSEMAAALRDHWGSIFSERHIDEDRLSAWLFEVFPDGGSGRVVSGLPLPTSSDWHITRAAMEDAVNLSSDSMPGPDGIPYIAWRSLGTLGIDLLFDAAKALATEEGPRLMQSAHDDEEGTHGFNLGILCCLPKKVSGTDMTAGDYYSAVNTRPLSIVNTDNRLIANAYRLRWEPFFNKWVSDFQRGFLPERSMLANVVDVDFEAMTISLQHARGAVILFDFKAAFPSISHDYLHRVLRHIGLPDHGMHLVESLYNENRCVIACGGSQHAGFDMKAGIRQGCPLSPLLFATVVDLLLRRLSNTFSGELLRAFADDTAMVVKDWWRSAADIAAIFEEFGRISGLVLNMPKTVIIPLWPVQLETLRLQIAEQLPGWKNVAVSFWGTYLGFAVGPEKRDRSWVKALQRFKDRIVMWNWSGLGLHYAATAYNTYAISVLSYIGQLELPPARVTEAEHSALRKAAPGPGNWMKSEDLWFFKECYGGTTSFANLSFVAWASQIRVATWESRARGGLNVDVRVAALEDAMTTGDHMGRRRLWADWYKRSHVNVLRDAVERMQRLGFTTLEVMTHIAKGAERPWSERQLAMVKKGFQCEVRVRLLARNRPDAEMRVRHKLKRWHIEGNPRVNAERALRQLSELRRLVPPRVLAAVFSTIWNRWPTARRFQQRSSARNRCMLGCPGRAEDSLEHYGRCKVLLGFACRRLNLRFANDDALPYWMFVAHNRLANNEADTQTKIAVLAYAAYRTTNAIRSATRSQENSAVDGNSTDTSSEDELSSSDSDSDSSDSSSGCDCIDNDRPAGVDEREPLEMLAQFVHEAVRGHHTACRTIDSCWEAALRGNPRQRRD